MKLKCTIGTQCLSDGRRYNRGDEYEVDDATARTLIAMGYATKISATNVTEAVKDKEDKKGRGAR